MTVSTIHKLDKIILAGPVEFDQISDSTVSAEINTVLEYPAGHTYPIFRANESSQPELKFTTPQLSTLLGAVGVGGASLGVSDAYLKKATKTGSEARAALLHTRLRINESFVYWTRIRLRHNGKSEADVIVVPNWDGTNDPIMYAGTLALTGNLTATEYFGAGPCKINGNTIPAPQEIILESGVRLIQIGGESDLWDSWVGLETAAPTVTIVTPEAINWGATIGLEGVALDGAAGITFYARKFAANGSRVLNATAEHIKFIGLLGSAIPMDTSGQGSSPISDTLKCELVSTSDAVVPLIGTINTAIT